MQAFADTALAFVERCSAHSDLDDLVGDFSGVLADFGISRFMMTRLPAAQEDPEPLILAHTWAPEWLCRYREQRYFWTDPVSHYALSHNRPFTWAEARRGSRRTRVAQRIASEAKSLGMADGIGFPLADPTSVQAVVSLGADHTIDLPTPARALLHLACLYCELRAVELVQAAAPAPHGLTPREREVLQWMAGGKSAWETSVILNTSQRTVEAQIYSARQKLQASNTPQAIAKALYTRQILL